MPGIFYSLLALSSLGVLLFLAILPMGLSIAQDISIAVVIALVAFTALPGRVTKVFFITLCTWVSLRYFSWRIASFPLDGSLLELFLSALLLMAETYGIVMLLLGIFVNAFPLEREKPPLPADKSEWPTVDVYIPTYSEPVSVVYRTLVAATDIDYPADKLKIFVLDDGYPRSINPKTNPETALELSARTEELKVLCERLGATWLTREKNVHAKSGNMNSAMAQTKGELILILDADHVPTRDVLKNITGFFTQDKRLAFVQTPHFFVNADPIEKNLNLTNRMPSENEMFYRVVQKGLDLWNASFFCGSAALLRREAVIDVGGFSVDSITEDASTSLKMHQKGWRSAYCDTPMVAGLQPETFVGFTVQRLRWAMGMAQIMIKQNPLIIKGLSLGQRLSYFSVVVFWLFPFARVIFFISPFMALFFNLKIYPSGMEYFFIYTAPYLVAVILSFQKMFGKTRRFLISEVYESMQSFYTFPALISTILSPNTPTFKVTPKGETLTSEFVSEFNKPYYFFYTLTVVGVLWGVIRMVLEPENLAPLLLSVSWLGFNLLLLSACMGALVEKVQRRERPRIDISERVTVHTTTGKKDVLVLNANEEAIRFKFVDKEKHEVLAVEIDSEVITLGNLESGSDSYLGQGVHVYAFKCASPAQERASVRFAYGKSTRWQAVWAARESSSNIFVLGLDLVQLSIRSASHHIRHLLEKAR